jgi:ankyrin repeat protein
MCDCLNPQTHLSPLMIAVSSSGTEPQVYGSLKFMGCIFRGLMFIGFCILQNDNYFVVRYLLEHDADPNARSMVGTLCLAGK